jgi:hypothetical protein
MIGQTKIPRGVVGLGVYSPLGAGRNAFIGHDGGTGGFRSTLALLQQERFGLFASYNSEGLPERVSAPDELLARMAERYFAGVKLPSNADRGIDVAGVYEPTRRVESSFFKLRSLLEQVAVRPVSGMLMIRPAMLPFGEPLDEIEPGLFHWLGRDVSFAGADRSAVMQIGAPVGLSIHVSWWASAGIVVPTVSVGLVTAAVAVFTWPLTLMRRRRVETDSWTRPTSAIRLALLFDLIAISVALWLVLWGWPLAAVSSPAVVPLVLGIYAAAWAAVMLTPLAVWSALRSARNGVGIWIKSREALLAVVHVTLVLFSLHWRIAGTTLAF